MNVNLAGVELEGEFLGKGPVGYISWDPQVEDG